MDGVILTPLKQIYNPNGNVFHGIKRKDPGFEGFGEAYFSMIDKGKIKKWKKYLKMTLNIIKIGEIKFVIYDEISLNFFSIKLSQKNYQRLTIKPGLWMSFQGFDQTNFCLILQILNMIQIANILDLDKINYDW